MWKVHMQAALSSPATMPIRSSTPSAERPHPTVSYRTEKETVAVHTQSEKPIGRIFISQKWSSINALPPPHILSLCSP